jgi:uncharacterized membrane protein YphA (DoxX/SURF4 family)
VVAALTIALELGGGILLAVGYKARWVALPRVFSVIAAVIFHNFWASRPRRDGPADQLHEEHHHRGRHADGLRLRTRPPQRGQS